MFRGYIKMFKASGLCFLFCG